MLSLASQRTEKIYCKSVAERWRLEADSVFVNVVTDFWVEFWCTHVVLS